MDYRFLNLCTSVEGGVIPNIGETLRRIGDQKPKYFAVMDLTSGYHQAPIAEGSIPYTAFITHRGVYEWVRVPMGLKGAPNYFQRELSNQVLGGLLGHACELYVDDLIIFGSTEEEFLDRLEQVFQRLQDHNVTCNPEKCRFGLTSVEYIGRIIDAEGLSVSEEKKKEVMDFPLPVLLKDMQSFMGLINYFSDHLRNLASELCVLRRFHENAKSTKKLVWTQEMINRFNQIKSMMAVLPKLYFLNSTDPVIVYTDASDYGIGAYVCQVVEGHERPIAFMSRALSGQEKNWTTIEKRVLCYIRLSQQV